MLPGMRAIILGFFAISGLAAADLVCRDGGQVRSFTLAGDERAFVGDPAVARKARAIPGDQAVDGGLVLAKPGAQAAGSAPVLYDGGRRDAFHRRIATAQVLIGDGVDAAAVGAIAVAPTSAKGWRLATFADADAALAALPRLRALGEADPLLLRIRAKRAADPLAATQWNLAPVGGGTYGLNAAAAWSLGTTGVGVTVAVIDDGLQIDHEDLAANCPVLGSIFHFNWNSGPSNDPRPQVANGDGHGTSCGGLVAMVGGNGVGGIGVASGSRLFGLRLIAAAIDDLSESQAIGWRTTTASDGVMVSTNSWGPNDNGATVEGPGPLAAAAREQAVISGRGGKGVVYCWAGGNGGGSQDDSNWDGYANSPFVIAIGAALRDGTHPSYSEPGANLLVSAPSGPSPQVAGQGLVTTDVPGSGGFNPASGSAGDYFAGFNGTSGATPQVAGVCALLLQARPDLGWRDVQEILFSTASRLQPGDAGWVQNAGAPVRLWHHHQFGGGLVDAGSAVGLATTWVTMPGETVQTVDSGTLALAIPDNDPLGVNLNLDAGAVQPMRVEHVQLAVRITHPFRGDLRLVLTSPGGTASTLTGIRPNDGGKDVDWTFMTVRCWGEQAVGTWKLTVSDEGPLDVGTLVSARLILRGTRLIPGFDAGNSTSAAQSIAVPASLGGAAVTGVSASEAGVVVASGTSALPLTDLLAGVHRLTVTISTTTGSIAFPFTLSISGTPPVITSRPTLTASEGDIWTYQASGSANGLAGGSVRWSLLRGPPGMAVSDTGLMTWTIPGSTAAPGTSVHVPAILRATTIVNTKPTAICDQEILLLVVDRPGAPG